MSKPYQHLASSTNPLKARGKKYASKNNKYSYQQMMKQKRLKRMQEAVRLRLAGYQYHEIGQIMGVTKPTAFRYVQDGLTDTAAALENDSASLRTMELERLEAMWKSLWPKAVDGDTDAIDRCMRISMQRTRLLGLDIDQVELVFDEQAMAVLAEIITRRVDPRVASLIQADFASYATLHGQRELAKLPEPDDTVEGEFKEVANNE